MDTFFPSEKKLERKWFVVDAESATLGRLSARIAAVLRGKHKPTYTPHADTGDFVVVINADKVKLTGNKLAAKTYERYSGYPGGLTVLNARTLLAAKPEELIRIAVRGMLPKTALGRRMFKKLKVYKGNAHPHQAQKPETMDVKEARRA
ncbi:MAG TPA: 50S ribosomal protein L13 [Syntrophorhabdales bacterium]|nr:50S ribosomal protein L13 [Syntrophorhabdales bacterium]